jgi:hypothetical protein
MAPSILWRTRNAKRETRNDPLDVDLNKSVGLPSPMAKLTPRRLPALKALFTAVLLAAGSISAQASLLTRSVDACSMACCVEQGQCCCSPRHANVMELLRHGETSVESPLISTQCPDGCAGSQVFNSLFGRETRDTGGQPTDLLIPALQESEQASIAVSAILVDDSPPRGPPTLSDKL